MSFIADTFKSIVSSPILPMAAALVLGQPEFLAGDLAAAGAVDTGMMAAETGMLGIPGMSAAVTGAAAAADIGSAANLEGLMQMGQAAGLGTEAATAFAEGGGVAGSTAMGGGGIGFGEAAPFIYGQIGPPGVSPTFNAPTFGESVTGAAPVTDLSRAAPFTDRLRYLMEGAGGLGRAAGIGPVSGPLGIGSGLYGLYQSEQLKKLAERAAAMQDPFGSQRGMYQAQLQALMANPGSVTSLPGYQFQYGQGLEALNRSLAAGGYAGSGNQMIAAQKYGQDYGQNFYQQQLQNLMGLSGANIAPSGGNALLTGTGMGIDVAGRSLASLGYGAQRYGY